MVLQRAEEAERPGDVIVRNDERNAGLPVNVIE